MERGVPLTPAQVAEVKRVWLATANASDAARSVGCSLRTALRWLRREGVPDGATLYAQALDAEERAHLDVVRKARGKISSALDGENADVAELARAANDSLRAVSAVKMAHAKLSGAFVEKHEHTGANGSPLTIFAPPEREP